MSTEVHINTLVQEVEDAYKEAQAAVGTLKEKIDNLKTRFLSGDSVETESSDDQAAASEDSQKKVKAGSETQS